MEGKVLVVSTDPVLHEFLYHGPPASDYQVIKTKVHEILKATLDKTIPDLVILDARMPRLDGIESCLSIRQWSEAPIVMLSHLGGAGNAKVRGLDLFGDYYLTEPFGGTKLMVRTEQAMPRNSFCKN